MRTVAELNEAVTSLVTSYVSVLWAIGLLAFLYAVLHVSLLLAAGIVVALATVRAGLGYWSLEREVKRKNADRSSE